MLGASAERPNPVLPIAPVAAPAPSRAARTPFRAVWTRIAAFPAGTRPESLASLRFVPSERPDAGAFLSQDPRATSYRWSGGRIEPLVGTAISQTEDRTGIVSLELPDEGGRPVVETRSIESGRFLSRLRLPASALPRRRGTILSAYVPSTPGVRDATNWYDATTGKEVARPEGEVVAIGASGSYELVPLLPSDPRAPNGAYSALRRTGPDGRVTRIGVQPVEQAFSRFVGSPDGPFALEFSFIGVGIEVFSYSLVGESFRALPGNPRAVYDASRAGFLLSLYGRGDLVRGVRDHDPSLVCLDARSGAIRWRRVFADAEDWHTVRWNGAYVVRWERKGWEALDGATGRRLGPIPPPAPGIDRRFRSLSDGLFLARDPAGGETVLWRLALKPGAVLKTKRRTRL